MNKQNNQCRRTDRGRIRESTREETKDSRNSRRRLSEKYLAEIPKL